MLDMINSLMNLQDKLRLLPSEKKIQIEVELNKINIYFNTIDISRLIHKSFYIDKKNPIVLIR